MGLVTRVTPLHTAVRNCTRDEGWPFEVGNQMLISSHRNRLSNIGIGHGAVDAGFGYTYLNPKTGQEFSGVLGAPA
jgi:hypothetical protein